MPSHRSSARPNAAFTPEKCRLPHRGPGLLIGISLGPMRGGSRAFLLQPYGSCGPETDRWPGMCTSSARDNIPSITAH
jgi:hypothetical protein